MRKLFLMGFLISSLLSTCAIPPQSRQTPTAPTPQLDTPRYRPEEVVDLVKTKLTEVALSPGMVRIVQTAQGNATHTGKGVWSVTLIDGIFTFREVTQTVVAANEAAALIMAMLKVAPVAPVEPCWKGGTTIPC